MKKISWPGCLVLCSVLLASCASGRSVPAAQQGPSLNKSALSQQLVQRDWDLFAGFQRQDFSDRVSDEFMPDKYAFLNETEASFHSATPLNFSFTIDKALMQGQKLAVTFSWQKKAASRSTGSLILKEGRCTTVYQNQNGQWLIYKIQGNSIFTF